ncbi:protein of unknown function (plasmid) [Magnetospirillum sp. XM-1]|uniref:hypothetical protein n=1 Tax=Magnetospirillum sp. XM-1 TaxID=1663591 RepID=UPI00073E0893|nr:hypothetical protein [Magnetospirillum sp. XM-1]CUW41883.1 protein of unknown function [Magnetospirillum sp. XM-1]
MDTTRAFIARDIEWETDGEAVRLPERVRVGFDDIALGECDLSTLEGRKDATMRILGWISDRYGWLVRDCDLTLA